jgi:hypothetical protein
MRQKRRRVSAGIRGLQLVAVAGSTSMLGHDLTDKKLL